MSDTYTVRATAPSGKAFSGVLTGTNLDRLIVDANHCQTAAQTRQAMQDGRDVRAGKEVKRNGWTIALEAAL